MNPPRDEEKNSQIYVITGPPRSGSSLLAQIFHRQGVVMHMSSSPPDLDSPTGNCEDMLAHIVHNHLMGRDGLGHTRDWDHPRYCASFGKREVRLLEAYIRCRNSHAKGAWGIKDPRICFLIEPWHEATRNLNVHWIYTRRENHEAMVLSLLKMLPARLRHCGDPAALYRLACNWAESYRLACELGFAKTGISPYCVTYEEMLVSSGQQRLAAKFHFKEPIGEVNPELNRCGGVAPGNSRLFRRPVQ